MVPVHVQMYWHMYLHGSIKTEGAMDVSSVYYYSSDAPLNVSSKFWDSPELINILNPELIQLRIILNCITACSIESSFSHH